MDPHNELHDYRGYAGQVASGTVRPGDALRPAPGGRRTTVAGVDTADGPLDAAGAGRSVTILLEDDIDISRGDLLAAADAPPRVTSELETTIAGSRRSRCARAPGCCSSTAPGPRK